MKMVNDLESGLSPDPLPVTSESSFLIEVTTQNYIGPLWITPVKKYDMTFLVYLQGTLLGMVNLKKIGGQMKAYSYQLSDKEMIEQIEECILHLLSIPY